MTVMRFCKCFMETHTAQSAVDVGLRVSGTGFRTSKSYKQLLRRCAKAFGLRARGFSTHRAWSVGPRVLEKGSMKGYHTILYHTIPYYKIL